MCVAQNRKIDEGIRIRNKEQGERSLVGISVDKLSE